MRLDWFRILFAVAFFSFIGVCFLWWMDRNDGDNKFLSPKGVEVISNPTPLPLLNYSFDNLSERDWKQGEIQIAEEIEDDNDKIGSYLFYFESDGKRVSGMMKVPEGIDSSELIGGSGGEDSSALPQDDTKSIQDDTEIYPVIVMLRGYVDKEIYHSGIGTERAAEVFAENGYVTLALDYLGFGNSDPAYTDVWEERFSRPVQVLNLLVSVGSLPFVDTEKIGIWAHSNGGQVALSVLEITGAEIPTTLWAPVTKPFPYSVLYYTDEFDDEGLYLRKELARLEMNYDVRKYSIGDYLGWIKASMQLHQGSSDAAVPFEWSREFVDKFNLNKPENEIKYYEYEGADHNMLGSWDKVVKRDLDFFEKSFE